EATEPFTVRYGYVENFVPQVLPAYREGEVSIEFTISNTGELPFKDAVHFELFQLGNPTPLYTADKTYNLYPGEQPITDALGFSLAPGSYELQYKTGKGVPRSVPVNVLPSGIGQFSITPEIKYPAGQVQIPYTLQNIDAGQGEFTLVYRLFIDPSAPVSSGTLNQWVDAGQSLSDSIILAVPQPGNYTLAVTCVKIPGGEQIIPVRVLPVKQTTAVVEAQPVANGVLPVTVRIENTGHEVFSGTLIVEADGQRYEEPLTVDSDRVFQTDSRLDTGNFSPGDREVKARIIDAEGNTMSESVRVVTVKAADIVFVSANNGNPIEIGPGGYADAAVKLRNNGDRSGEASIRFRAFDTLDDTRQVLLAPGEEIQLTGIYIDAYGDIPEGNYPCRYTLTGPGVAGGFSEGNIPFHVSGLKTDVSAALDRQSYQPGESALLTIDVSSPDVISAPVPLEAVVNWGNFSEARKFSLTSGGPASLAFNLPIPDQYVPVGKIFYGIYRERGRGIHLNDIYIRVNSAGVSIIPDKQVYMPDEIIHALVESEQSGTLTAEIFDQTQTITINGSGTLQFAIPADTPGGTYSIRWSLTPGDPQGEMKSGGAPLDVSGLVVKVAKSELEKGKYAPGEIVKAALQLESNQDAGISLLSWSVTPSEVWEYWGRQELTVTGAVQSAAHIEHSLNTTEAGTHRLVYGLYQGDVLIASGSISFDCGDAVLLGLSTDKSEYKNGNENVKTRVDYFGQGNAQLELYLDNEKANDQGLTLSGVGSVEITLNSGGLTGGAHNLKALLTKDGLTSTKTTGFIYGSNLPDLSINLEETSNDGLNYTYKLRVVNSGKTASAASTLSFTDNGSVVETKSVSGLAAGQSEEVVIDWSGSGKAGAHTLVFTVDPGNAVKEFSETNNKLEITREVPALVYTLEAQPQVLAANTTATFITRLINNQPAALALSLEMALTNNETGQEIFQRTKTEELPALGSKTISDNFNAGIYPAGEYTLRQVITGGDIDMAQETWIVISPTKAMTANLAVTPLTVPSGVETDIRLTMQLKNTGNIALENEPLIIEVYHNEGNDVVKTEETQVTLALSEEKTVTRSILVNLVEGSYEIRLKYDEEEIANVVIKAAAAVESEKVVHIKPRVLVMNFNLALFNRAQPDFVYAVLNAGRVEYDTGQGIIESYVKWHKNYANMNIVFTGMLGRNIRAELKERVWRGEGLIVVCDNPIQSPDMEEFLGVRIKPVGGNSGETSIRLLPGELTAGGDAELMVKNRLAFTGIGSDVKVAAETARKKEPVMVYRKFGNGDILVICVPLQFKSGAGVVSQLILNAVTRFSRDVYTQSPLTRVLPIAITLNNQSDREIQLTVKELLPYGVEGYDYTPNPEPGEELKWNIAIPDAAKKSIDYWLKLPDKINSYDVKTEIYEGESKLEDVSLSLEVSQTVMSQITELVVELGAVEAAGRDAQNIRKAITSLEALRGRTGEGIPEHLRNLWDSTRAAGYIGSVKDVDVSGLRIKAQEIMIAVGRRFYEKVTAEGTSSSVLNSLTQMINGD
ncbi:MAG: hypothetical protein QG657_2991, partial [Acidobacteriota bacterium]|nr:hypothetical protein [Acidobacteriota bacterium]